MKAQIIYDLQREVGIFSGNEMHDFFRKNTENNDPSPSGNCIIDDVESTCFIIKHVIEAIEHGYGSDIILNDLDRIVKLCQ